MDSAAADAPTATALTRLGESRDADAWRLIIERHGTAMYRAAFAVTRDGHLAEDASQEAFLQVRDGAHRFRPRGGDPEAAARGWLVRVATTTALKLLRGSRRRLRRELALTGKPSAEKDQLDAGDEQREAQASALQRAIAELPRPYREALLLHAYAGFGYPEIAAALGTREGTARMRVHRALARLRRRLARAGAAAAVIPLASPAALAGIAPPAGAPVAWSALLHAPMAPTLAAQAVFGGGATAGGIAVVAGALAALACVAIPIIAARRDVVAPTATTPVAPAAFDLAALPTGSWVRVQPTWDGAPDGGNLVPGGLNNVGVYDPGSRRVLGFECWYDPVRKVIGHPNAVVAYDASTNRATVLKLDNFELVQLADHAQTMPLAADAADPTPINRSPMGDLALVPELDRLYLGNGFNAAAYYRGIPGNPITDTWAFDLRARSWRKVSDERSAPPNPPLVTGGQVMAYDPAHRVIAQFVDDSDRGSQTWLLDPFAGAWRAVPRDPSCAAVHASGAGIAYDPVRGRILLFATVGMNPGPANGQLWAYDVGANRWTALADCPQPASIPGFACDPTHDRFLALIGSDTWAYDPAADSWSRLGATLERRTVTSSQSITYDVAHDVWVFQGGTWDDPLWALLRLP